jgi:hypothetical protein
VSIAEVLSSEDSDEDEVEFLWERGGGRTRPVPPLIQIDSTDEEEYVSHLFIYQSHYNTQVLSKYF